MGHHLSSVDKSVRRKKERKTAIREALLAERSQSVNLWVACICECIIVGVFVPVRCVCMCVYVCVCVDTRLNVSVVFTSDKLK